MTDPARTPRRDPRLSFGSVAAAYERGRPAYPTEAVEWLLGSQPLSVLELGAGTGKLTSTLVELGHDVFATDPDEQMLDVLSARLPDVRATVGTAEQIPVPDRSYDAVVAGQAFHWFDLELALPEIGRVLKPGGRVALIWNLYDTRIPWVRRLGRLLGQQDAEREDLVAELDESGMVSAIDERSFRHWHVVHRETIQDLARSRSNIASLDTAAQDARVEDVLAFYDAFGRGMDGMQLPFHAACYRASFLPLAQVLRTPDPEPAAPPDSSATAGSGEDGDDDVDAVARVVTDSAYFDRPLFADSRTDTAERLPRIVTDTADRIPRVLTEPVDRTFGPDDDTGIILFDFR
ncbi:class I SAM-dependent methyltransferase [Nocardioides insulae]|uniref:class I SAM-dependent methyltransferase n=1 Tax=Nocardioides insulae TaxID=394734 RepID=UPI00040C2E9A|nr:class I SAM-dependent methyltransferase [Nocardioides insulae]